MRLGKLQGSNLHELQPSGKDTHQLFLLVPYADEVPGVGIYIVLRLETISYGPK